MIETRIINENPTIIYHQVSGRMNEDDAATGAAKAMSIVGNIACKNLKFDLILDMRGYIFDNLNAHKIWSIGFKEQNILRENVERTALIGDDTPNLKAEKEVMESDILKFFIELEAANQWLKSA